MDWSFESLPIAKNLIRKIVSAIMKIENLILIGFLSMLFSLGAFAQDLQYTQDFFTPISINPAFVGSLNNSYKINGLVTDQTKSVSHQSYSSYSLNTDVSIDKGIRDGDWFGVGVRINRGKSVGDTRAVNFFALSFASHLALDDKKEKSFSIGIQYGLGQLSKSISFYSFGSVLHPNQINVNVMNWNESFMNKDRNFSELAFSLLYTVRNKNRSNFKVGVGYRGTYMYENLNGKKISAFTSYEFDLTSKATFTSGGYYDFNMESSNLILNTIMSYKIEPRNKIILHAGVGMRDLKGGLVYFGATVYRFRLGIGYDLGVRDTIVFDRKAELSISYLGRIRKNKKLKSGESIR